MLKTMKNQMLPEKGEGCRYKGKTPKKLLVSYWLVDPVTCHTEGGCVSYDS